MLTLSRQLEHDTFSDKSKIFTHSEKSLRYCTPKFEGNTYMRPAVVNLIKVITESTLKQFRILTIIDGNLHDQNHTLNTTHIISQ